MYLCSMQSNLLIYSYCSTTQEKNKIRTLNATPILSLLLLYDLSVLIHTICVHFFSFLFFLGCVNWKDLRAFSHVFIHIVDSPI